MSVWFARLRSRAIRMAFRYFSENAVEGIREFDGGCLRQGESARDEYWGRFAFSRFRIKSFWDSANAAKREVYDASNKRCANSLIGENFWDIWVVDNARFLVSVGHRDLLKDLVRLAQKIRKPYARIGLEMSQIGTQIWAIKKIL